MRLDKLLAHAGNGTRKEVKNYIKKGYVMVNGEVITDDGYKVDEINDEVTILDKSVNYEKNYYIMLNKPDGYISATYDPNDPIVLDLIPDEIPLRGLFPVGRLDKDTEGLLLITNDGMLAHRMLSPKYHVDKKYYLEFDGKLDDKKIKKIETGVELDDGYLTMPSKYESINENSGYLIIKEGKYHQVKRMLEAVDCKVTYLKRIEFGSLKLDENLKLGETRLLTSDELENIKLEAGLN